MGKHIHIALIGGQAAPVYNAISVLNPDKVVLLYSEQSEANVERLKEILTKEKGEEFIDKEMMIPADRDAEIKRRAEELSAEYRGEQISVNITSGTKNWSYHFTHIFEERNNADIVYFDQNNKLHNLTKGTITEDFTFDMFVHFQLYGNELKHYTKFEDYTDEDKKAVEEIEKIRNHGITIFNELLVLLSETNNNILKNSKSGEIKSQKSDTSYVRWEKNREEGNQSVTIAITNKKKGLKEGKKEVTITSPHAISLAFHSGWFEYKVAEIISKIDGVKQILLNCRFPFKANMDKNEVDILVNTGKKVLFVECKTQIKKNTDIDKFNSVVKAYGGMGSKALFVTQSPMEDIVKSKCDQYSIIYYSLEENTPKRNTLLGDHSKGIKLKIGMELNSINTK